MEKQIKFDERNYRKHGKKNKELIKKSLEELGAGRSVLLDNEDCLIAGNVHKCCLCKAAGGFFGVERCTVPCVMYNSNKSGELVLNKYGFAI